MHEFYMKLISWEDEGSLLKKSKRSEINPAHRWDGKSMEKRSKLLLRTRQTLKEA